MNWLSDIAQTAFREWFGLSRAESAVVVALYRSKGEWISTSMLAHVCGISLPSLAVHVHAIRSAMECEAIDNEPGKGYRLTDIGMGECLAALWRMGEHFMSMGEELRRAG